MTNTWLFIAYLYLTLYVVTVVVSETFLYYSYGSNLLAQRIHIHNPSAVRRGIAKLKNYRLDFELPSERWHGCVATIVPHKGHHVWGALWEINIKHLETLDRQEGVTNNHYFRFEVNVKLPDGKTETCQTYQLVTNPQEYFELDKLPPERQPSQIYLNTIINGSRESQLPKKYQRFLKKVAHNDFNGPVDLLL